MIATTSFQSLRGHRGPINCVEAAPDGVIFASGSDDKTLRIWDIRQSPQRAQYCLCECFPDAVDCITFNPKAGHSFYAASGSQIFAFDLRSFGASAGNIIQKTPLCIINPFDALEGLGDASDNEINTIRIHPKGDHMAIGDDKGNVIVLERGGDVASRSPPSWRISKCLSGSRGVHTSIIGSVAFRPNSTRELVSGGFDCLACSWDFGLGKSLGVCDFRAAPASAAATEGAEEALLQIFNPPFVHALQYVASGKAIVSCLGDGSLRVVKSNTMSALLSVEAHGGMATCLHVLSGDAGVDTDIVTTGGVDGIVKGWRLSHSSSPSASSPAAPRSSKKDLPLTVQAEPLFHIEHDCKVNAVAAFPGASHSQVHSVVVADTSNALSLYNF